MPGRFEGKVAIVTGAASGIGRAVAAALVREGASVLLADRDEPAGRAAEEAIGEPARCGFLRADVTRASDCAAMVEAARERFGGLDLLVNSAGIGEGGPAASLDEAVWDRVLDVNLKGTFLACRAAFPLLAERGGGSIVNLASLAALVAAVGLSAYSASKAGVVQFTRVLALEGAPQRIRVNALCPTWIDTPMVRRHLDSAPNPERARRGLEASVPLGRLGTVEDVAAAALFLLSDEAAFITGVALPVDGGTHCGPPRA